MRVYLEPQPDEIVPRFEYEKHLADLVADPPRWPESTRRISQLRLTIEYASTRFWKRQLGRERLHIDIVDYPGEWLLDLPLLRLDYRDWSRTALEQSRRPGRKKAAKPWHASLGLVDPTDPADEALAETLSDLFKAYLRESRADPHALSTLAAWPLPHAGRSGRLAGAHLRPPRCRRGWQLPARLAVDDDGAALRSL